MINCIHECALQIIMQVDPTSKCEQSKRLAQDWEAGQDNHWAVVDNPVVDIPVPGRPAYPELVAPKDLPKRSLHTEQGRLVLMHAIAHIEFNAINLAWDAVYRFREQPKAFYDDWIRVAADEARHFLLVCDYLQQHGCHYGHYPAHNGLWEMTVKTQHDIVARMALVPRVLEARGLDVTPAMIKKLEQAGDQQAVDILSVIYQDEISHVQAGTRWFHYHCERHDLEPEVTFKKYIAQYMKGRLRGPFNREARLAAGFSKYEIDNLEQS